MKDQVITLYREDGGTEVGRLTFSITLLTHRELDRPVHKVISIKAMVGPDLLCKSKIIEDEVTFYWEHQRMLCKLQNHLAAKACTPDPRRNGVYSQYGEKP